MKTRTFLLSLALAAGSWLPAPAADPVKPGTPAPTPPPSPNPAPAATPVAKMETVTLATGCFWCTEVILSRMKGVQKATSGYINGKIKDPTYEQVCTGLTGHAEAVEVVFDPAVLPFETLAHLFFDMHDPTTLNQQGNDKGTQYRSGIFYHTEEQKAIALKVKEEAGKSGKFESPIVTEITKAEIFYPAEDYHQDYFDKNVPHKTGNYRYCQSSTIPKLKKLGLLKPQDQ
ncbi:MAG: peptide-methionine (S)-S-oxide reductase MsrA [Verrucomicrobiota bacterium]